MILTKSVIYMLCYRVTFKVNWNPFFFLFGRMKLHGMEVLHAIFQNSIPIRTPLDNDFSYFFCSFAWRTMKIVCYDENEGFKSFSRHDSTTSDRSIGYLSKFTYSERHENILFYHYW